MQKKRSNEKKMSDFFISGRFSQIIADGDSLALRIWGDRKIYASLFTSDQNIKRKQQQQK